MPNVGTNIYDLSRILLCLRDFHDTYNTEDIRIFFQVTQSQKQTEIYYATADRLGTKTTTIGGISGKFASYYAFMLPLFEGSFTSKPTNRVVSQLIHTLTEYDKKEYEGFTLLADTRIMNEKYNYLYIWYSFKDNCINMYSSNIEYDELLNDDKFQ